MRGWLKYYNELDTVPLAHAIDNSFRNFFAIFGIDPGFCVSLPRFAQQCMFSSYDESEPLCYSYWKKESELRELTRENLTGGLVNVFHRCVDLSERPGMPHASQFAPNGKKFSSLMFYDFNSLYLYAQLLPFPATPGKSIFLRDFWNLKYFSKIPGTGIPNIFNNPENRDPEFYQDIFGGMKKPPLNRFL